MGLGCVASVQGANTVHEVLGTETLSDCLCIAKPYSRPQHSDPDSLKKTSIKMEDLYVDILTACPGDIADPAIWI